MTDNNDEFYKDAETKLKNSGNYESPRQKQIELRKGIKRFVERKLDEEPTN